MLWMHIQNFVISTTQNFIKIFDFTMKMRLSIWKKIELVISLVKTQILNVDRFLYKNIQMRGICGSIIISTETYRVIRILITSNFFDRRNFYWAFQLSNSIIHASWFPWSLAQEISFRKPVHSLFYSASNF